MRRSVGFARVRAVRRRVPSCTSSTGVVTTSMTSRRMAASMTSASGSCDVTSTNGAGGRPVASMPAAASSMVAHRITSAASRTLANARLPRLAWTASNPRLVRRRISDEAKFSSSPMTAMAIDDPVVASDGMQPYSPAASETSVTWRAPRHPAGADDQGRQGPFAGCVQPRCRVRLPQSRSSVGCRGPRRSVAAVEW